MQRFFGTPGINAYQMKYPEIIEQIWIAGAKQLRTWG